ncbi:uncharacterized protein LOC142363933 [Opisthocomus hoazin]|uniref:uncharacterized protein LOC142363933 n=1 Tax=Opisthocomus hoazin TaxID=30419 RepID=UPI003F52B4C5
MSENEPQSPVLPSTLPKALAAAPAFLWWCRGQAIPRGTQRACRVWQGSSVSSSWIVLYISTCSSCSFVLPQTVVPRQTSRKLPSAECWGRRDEDLMLRMKRKIKMCRWCRRSQQPASTRPQELSAVLDFLQQRGNKFSQTLLRSSPEISCGQKGEGQGYCLEGLDSFPPAVKGCFPGDLKGSSNDNSYVAYPERFSAQSNWEVTPFLQAGELKWMLKDKDWRQDPGWARAQFGFCSGQGVTEKHPCSETISNSMSAHQLFPSPAQVTETTTSRSPGKCC